MAQIYVENKAYEVEDGQNLLAACLSLGFDLPYFCWHPLMHSVGACRQCAVKQFRDRNDARGKIVMACMTAASDGARISIRDPEAHAFRAAVIEWLMLNHPHDCPVCDEGGECHLQDMTVMSTHARRSYRGPKRTFRNQNLGPFVNHEMNRCIQCYRCVRFYRDYAGGRDLEAFSLRSQVYFGRHESGVLESEFSGNLVEICPTGVFTDKSLGSHYARKWDLTTAPSVCVHCALGCNTIPGERYGSLRRIRNRFNGEVNGYFLCDRGRYGYEFVNSPRRLRRPLLRRREGAAEPLPAKEALAQLRRMIKDSRGLFGIGSPRASLEANYALRRLVGPDRFAAGASDADLACAAAAARILAAGPARSASLADVRSADAVLVLGVDPNNYAPMLALALRQSVRQAPLDSLAGDIPAWDDAAVREALRERLGPLYLAAPAPTGIDGIATGVYRAAPADIARLGFAVAARLGRNAPRVEGLSGAARRLSGEVAQALREARRPLIVAGAGLGSEALLEAAANVAWALVDTGRSGLLSLALPEANSMGVALMAGARLERAATAVRSGEADTLIILENDLYRRADQFTVEGLLKARRVIVLDSLMTATAARADLALPAATFAESSGTLVSSEGRAQRYFQVMPPAGEVLPGWRWLGEAAAAAGALEAPWPTLDDLIGDMVAELPALAGVKPAAPDARFRILDEKVARQPHRYSGRAAMTADVDVSEPAPPADPDTPLAFTMEGFQGRPPAPLVPRYWAPGWNSVQALNRFQQEVGGPLRGGDPGVRLLEPGGSGDGAKAQSPDYFPQAPEAFERRPDQWLVAPLHHIFGSEELSSVSERIRRLAPAPFVALNPEDAAGLGAEAGERLELTMPGGSLRLPLRLMPSLPAGVAGVSVYPPGLEGIVIPGGLARIRVADQGQGG